jgi:hypothetical protein
VIAHSVTKKKKKKNTEFWSECYGNLVVALSLRKQKKYNSGGCCHVRKCKFIHPAPGAFYFSEIL